MHAMGGEHQLGDFVKGRMLFIEDYCRKKGQDLGQTMEAIKAEALRLAGTDERRKFLESRLFSGSVLPSSFLPDWLDRVFLEATTHVLKGKGAALYTTTSRLPCIPFEAGRFNAHRQADTIFRILFEHKRPEEWLTVTFPGLYKKCYGEEALASFSVEALGPGKYRITMDNRTLEKACPVDCATTIGYLFGSMERLGAQDPLVIHPLCGAGKGREASLCVFEVSWK